MPCRIEPLVPGNWIGKIMILRPQRQSRPGRQHDGMMTQAGKMPGEGIDDRFLPAEFGEGSGGVEADSHGFWSSLVARQSADASLKPIKRAVEEASMILRHAGSVPSYNTYMDPGRHAG